MDANDTILSKNETNEFLKIYNELKKPLSVYIYYRVYDSDIGADILSNVFLKLLLNWKNINKSSIKSWLYTVTRNEIVDYFRKNNKNISLEDAVLENMEFCEDKDQNNEFIYNKNVLKNIIESLQPKAKEIVMLKIYQELTFQEIGGILNLDESTVKTLYYRAIDKIYDEINGKFKGNPKLLSFFLSLL